jgi:SH3-like domain-containing protein
VRRAAALLLLAACSRTPPPGAAGPTGPSAAPSGPAAQAAAPLPVAPDGRAWVTAAASLRREPSEAPRVAGPGGKQVSNYLLVLQRGEPVALVEGRDDWAKVKTSGDQVGWLKRASLLEDGATVATVLAAADVFDRPDLLAANPRR